MILSDPTPNREYRFDPLLTMVEVAAHLGVSRATVYTFIGVDPTFKTFCVGRQRRMRESALLEWVAAREAAAA